MLCAGHGYEVLDTLGSYNLTTCDTPIWIYNDLEKHGEFLLTVHN